MQIEYRNIDEEAFPHIRAALGGAKYAINAGWDMFVNIYPFLKQDVYSEAIATGWETYINGGNGKEVFSASKRHTENFLYGWAKDKKFDFSRLKKKPDLVPILPIARLIFAKLRKKGRRGIRSAAIKAYIVQQKLCGVTFRRIARGTETLNQHHQMSEDNVKRHYQSATGIIFDISRGNVTR